MPLEDELGGKTEIKIYDWFSIETVSSIVQQILDYRN